MLDLQQLLSRGREGLFCGGEEWKWWWCCSGTGLWFAGGYFLVQPTTPSDVQPSPQAFLILRSVGNICHYTHVIWASSLKLLCFTWRENLHSLFLHVHMEQWCPLKSHKDYILFFFIVFDRSKLFFESISIENNTRTWQELQFTLLLVAEKNSLRCSCVNYNSNKSSQILVVGHFWPRLRVKYNQYYVKTIQ